MSASSTPPTSGLPTGLEKVAETLHCPLCLDFYKDPVALTCQHNFCRGCIRKVVPRWVGAYHALECPLCRKIMQLSCRNGVDNIPKNFEREAIVETFQVAERDHARTVRSWKESVEESVTQDLVKQIDKIHMYSQEQEHEHMVRRSGERDAFSDAAEPLSDEVFFSQTHSGVDTGLQEEETALSEHAPIQQEGCPLTPQQQQQQQQQQRLRQLQQEQYKLQLKLEQQDALESMKNRLQQPQEEPDWRQQQTDRWNELQPPAEAEHQSVKQSSSSTTTTSGSASLPWNVHPQPYQYPQSLEHSQSLPYSLMPTCESYPYPSMPSSDNESYGYRGYPYPQEEKVTITQPSLSQTKETSCSECCFPASAHCETCVRFFCWQCLQDLHNTTRGIYAGHKVTELTASVLPSDSGDFCSPFATSSVSTPKQESAFTLNTAMASLNVASELASIGVNEQTYKIPYYCDIKAMGPGKHITVFGQPAQNCKRFHINFQHDKNSKTGDLALHFNPRFIWPVMVVRNSRMKGKYGSEERGGPQFPFMVGRPFKLEFICLLDKFEVRVDNQYFISYKHRIHDLASIKVFVIAGDVEISSVLGCC